MAAFPLVSSHKTVIYYDAGDYGVVEKKQLVFWLKI